MIAIKIVVLTNENKLNERKKIADHVGKIYCSVYLSNFYVILRFVLSKTVGRPDPDTLYGALIFLFNFFPTKLFVKILKFVIVGTHHTIT